MSIQLQRVLSTRAFGKNIQIFLSDQSVSFPTVIFLPKSSEPRSSREHDKFLSDTHALTVHTPHFTVFINNLCTGPSVRTSTVRQHYYYPFQHWPNFYRPTTLSSPVSASALQSQPLTFFWVFYNCFCIDLSTKHSSAGLRTASPSSTGLSASQRCPNHRVRADENNCDQTFPWSQLIHRSSTSSFTFTTPAHKLQRLAFVNILTNPFRIGL